MRHANISIVVMMGLFVAAGLLVGLVEYLNATETWYVYNKDEGRCVISPLTPKQHAVLVEAAQHVAPSVVDDNRKGTHTVAVLNPTDQIVIMFTASEDFCEFLGRATRAGESR